MRLTLRTLLAYMDDRLPPARAREIGLKIAQSPFAGELLERIRDVKRRRRIAAAATDSPSVEANLLAEYLDDQLSPDLVQRIEQKILASDHILAETAAAHELLGLLSDPIPLEPVLRERLYSLDPTGVEDVVRAAGRANRENSASPLSAWQPDQAGSKSARHWPTISAAALAVVWIISVVTDSSLFRSNSPPELAQAAEPRPAEIGPPQPIPATEPAPAEKQAPQPETNEPASDKTEQPPVIAAAEPPAQQKNMPEPPPAPMPEPAPEPNEPAPADLPQPARKAIFLQAENAAVLVADQQSGNWMNLLRIRGGDAVLPVLNAADCQPLLGSNPFGTPGSFEMRLRADGRNWQARTVGPGLFRLLPAGGGLEMLAGRLLVAADNAEAWPAGASVDFQLQAGPQSVTITLLSPDTHVAVEVEPIEAVAPPAAADAAALDADNNPPLEQPNFHLPTAADLNVRIVIAEGSATILAPERFEPVTLNSADSIRFRIVGGREWGGSERTSIAAGAIPPWMLESDAPAIPEKAAIQKRILDALAAPGIPAELVQPLLADKNPQVGVAAAEILCLTADTNQLLSALFESLDESIHRTVIEGLRTAVRSSVTARTAVTESLRTRLSMADAEFAMQLISGLNETQARDRLTTSQLVLWLQSESLTLRTLAIHEMERLAGNRQNFFPNADASRRRDAVNRWQRVIDRNNGTLLPM